MNEMLRQQGDTEFHHNGNLVVLKNVDFFQCNVCGERVFSEESTSKILSRLKTSRVTDFIMVPVYA